jgi:Arm DNA-binding domain
MPLTDVTVRQVRPKEKEYRLSDERGLLVVVRPNGAEWWRLRYRFQGRHQMISLGIYPRCLLIYSAIYSARSARRRPSPARGSEESERRAEG